jgi:hypothetical protein
MMNEKMTYQEFKEQINNKKLIFNKKKSNSLYEVEWGASNK